jgi:4-amino-4-deoxy-L-arabinose transferase-like glycosyltransferase
MKKSIYILLAIVVFSFVIRAYKITQTSLYGDELTIVQDAYSIAHTGKDVTGKPFPLTFSMGAGRPAGYVYFSIPFIALFGPTAGGVRMLSVLSGTGIVLLMFFLGKKLFSERVGVFAATMAAISPWDLNLSRGGFEAHFALFLVLTGIVLFLYCQTRPKLLILSAIFLGLPLFTYQTYKILLPLFLIGVFFITGGAKRYFSKGFLRYFIISSSIFLLFYTASLYQTLSAGTEQRFFSMNIFSDEEVRTALVEKINLDRVNDDSPPGISRLFHNKAVEYLRLLTKNYLENFSSRFLFIEGDGNPRHNSTQSGVFYIIEIILIGVGMAGLFIRKRYKEVALLGMWIALTPPSTIFLSQTHALRNSFMMPPLILLSALGLITLRAAGGRGLFIVLIGAILVQAVFVFEKLYFLSPKEFANFWSSPAKIASEMAVQNRQKYEYVFLSSKIDNVEFAYPVYAGVDPESVIDQNYKKVKLGNLEFKKFGNVYIGDVTALDIKGFLRDLDGSYLYVGDYLYDFENRNGLEEIRSEDLRPALVVYKYER